MTSLIARIRRLIGRIVRRMVKSESSLETARAAEINAPASRTMAQWRHDGLTTRFSTEGLGLEIGPLHNGLTTKAMGYNVRILDRKTEQELREKYDGHPIDFERIEKVDYIWNGEPYRQLVGDTRFDWIVASHVIEHVPDLIGFINDCESVLRPNGVLALVIPDLRYCFDALHAPSTLSEAIDRHDAQSVAATPGQVVDHYLNRVNRGGKGSWHPGEMGEYSYHPRHGQAIDFYQQARGGKVFDIHVWRFTPSSFRLLATQLAYLDLIGLREVHFETSAIGEFYVVLGRSGELLDRLPLSMAIADELSNR